MADLYPQVKVEDITESIKEPEVPNVQNLGNSVESFKIAFTLRKIQDALRYRANRVLRLTWKGNKVPRGVDVGNGKEILWTQHGQVIAGTRESRSGVTVGTYDRKKEFAGEGKDEHEMIVYLNV